MPTAETLLTSEEAAALLGVDRRTVHRWVKRGRIRVAKRVHTGYLFAPAELRKAIEAPRPRRGRPPVPPQAEQLPDAS